MAGKPKALIVASPDVRREADTLAKELTRAGAKTTAPDFSREWQGDDWRKIDARLGEEFFVVFIIGPSASEDSTLITLLWQIVPIREEPTGRFIFVVLDDTAAAHENVSPFLKRHYAVSDVDAEAIVRHITDHNAALQANAKPQRPRKRVSEPPDTSAPGPMSWAIGLSLGFFGAGFWLDAFGDFVELAPFFEQLLLEWRSGVRSRVDESLSWLPRYFGSEPPRWAYNYFPLTGLFWLTMIVLVVPGLVFSLISALRDGLIEAPRWSLNPPSLASLSTALLATPIALALTIAIWPIFLLFLPNALIALARLRVRRVDAIILLLFSPMLFFAALLGANAAAPSVTSLLEHSPF